MQTIVRDTLTKKAKVVDFANVGPFFREVRIDTPSDSGDFKSLTMVELMDRVNRHLKKKERPITLSILSRLEHGHNEFGGYLMRVMQVARALDCTVTFTSANRSATFKP